MHEAEARGKFGSAARAAQLRYAEAIAGWGEVGGYDAEVLFDTASTSAPSTCPGTRPGRGRCTPSPAGSRSASPSSCCCAAPTRCCCSTSRTTSSTYRPSGGWRAACATVDKSVLYVSHDRELLAQTATRVVTVEGGTAWTHPGGFASWHEAREARYERLDELRRRWDEEHQKLKDLVLMYKQKAAYNDGLASRYQAAQTRLRKFEEAGPPQLRPKDQDIRMRLAGGRTGKRSVICEHLELEDLTFPFDLEVWYGDRVAVLGANGTGKSHFLRLLARGGSDPDNEHAPVDGAPLDPVRHAGSARLGRPGPAGALLADPRPTRADGPHPRRHPLAGRRTPDRAAPARRHEGALPLRAGRPGRPALRHALGRAAGPVPGAAAGALRGHPAAARRADRQPGPGLGRGAGGRACGGSRAR